MKRRPVRFVSPTSDDTYPASNKCTAANRSKDAAQLSSAQIHVRAEHDPAPLGALTLDPPENHRIWEGRRQFVADLELLDLAGQPVGVRHRNARDELDPARDGLGERCFEIAASSLDVDRDLFEGETACDPGRQRRGRGRFEARLG